MLMLSENKTERLLALADLLHSIAKASTEPMILPKGSCPKRDTALDVHDAIRIADKCAADIMEILDTVD